MASPTWRERYVRKRNQVIGSPGFQRWAARFPGMRWMARKRATAMMDLIVGFSYSQTLRAADESGLIDALAFGPIDFAEICDATGLGLEGAQRLVRAARALDLAEEVAPGQWMLGEQGAALHSNQGARAMIRHHKLLYADMLDPLELLQKGKTEPTQLSRFWSYAGALRDHSERGTETNAYSELMASSQHFVAEQVLDSFAFKGVQSLLDVGGGHGAFAKAIGEVHPHLQLGVFDLPEVVEGARRAGIDGAHFHPGNFFEDPIPEDYDLVSLIRILHDHDDSAAQNLLSSIRSSLTPGKRLLIAEPMAEIPGAEPMGEAFFGFYLWAMGSGRPRSPKEIQSMLADAGFDRTQVIDTPQPVIASVIVATA